MATLSSWPSENPTESLTPPNQPSLRTTTQNIAFTIAQNGSFFWETRSYGCIVLSDLQNSTNALTENALRHAEQVYGAAVSETIEPFVYRRLLDPESAEVRSVSRVSLSIPSLTRKIQTIRKALLTLTVKADIGRSIGRVFEFFVSPETRRSLSSTSTPPTTTTSQTLATAFMASIYFFDLQDAKATYRWLSDILAPLIAQATYIHRAGQPLVNQKRQWPVDSYATLPVDLTEHIAQASHLQVSLSGGLPAPFMTSVSASPSPASVLRPSQAPCKLKRRKIVHTDPLDYHTFRRDQRIYDAAKASVLRGTKRRANCENVAPVAAE
ncbi:hypothetical protein ONZ45_g13009 [Pleurotus djamor]|nr:hypothetical protein ONZ45_g13009 [Pleurotus djamor]